MRTTTAYPKTVRLIRHGESAANAGAATQDHARIPLTDNGLAQARQVAHSFAQAPALIIASPFSRAQATASATAARFPSVAVETWPIEEFTYLAPAKCVNTTVADRRRWVEDYWLHADPAYIDGPGAESFLGFICRAQAFLERLALQPAQDMAVFSHGQFINAVAWLLECPPPCIKGDAMRSWRAYEIAQHVNNGCGYLLGKSAGEAGWQLTHRVSADGVREPRQ